MVSYVNSFTAIAGSNLNHIPFREPIVAAMALVGLVCLMMAVSLVLKIERAPLRLIED